MKLHGDLLSPFARMCMATAIECNLSMRVQLRATHVKPQETNSELEKVAPLGKVPALETDHGHAIYDSHVIMEYFCHVAGNKTLLPDEGSRHFRVLTLLALAQGLGDASVALRYETFVRPEPARWTEYAARLRQRINSSMAELEKSLGDLQDLSLAAIAAAAVLAYVDIRSLAPGWRTEFAGLSAWEIQFAKRESMQNTMPRV